MSDLPSLAQFLRSRRERLAPAQVGLKAGGRRRTPGLRREEVATLAGVSIDYLVRLEQGRDTHPSPEVLAALADALQLDGDEARYLFGLAAHASSPHLEQFCPAPPVLDAEVPSTIGILLDQLHPIAAFVVGPLGDVVASNGAWRSLVAPVGLSDLSNLVRHHFLHPEASMVFPDWDAAADAHVVRLRTAHAQLATEPALISLLTHLLEVPAFAERWAAHPVSQAPVAGLRLRHPEVGELRLSSETMDLVGRSQQFVTWLPADEATSAALGRALDIEEPASPAHLRVVGGD